MAQTAYAVSEGQRFNADTNLTVVKCFTCHVTYAIPTSFYNAALQWRGDRRDGQGWKVYCPFGHSWWYVGESEQDKLRRQLEETRRQRQAERELREYTERRLNAQKGATTKAKKRHAAGVCPCCSRSFVQLKRHMAAKHPDFLKLHGVEAHAGGEAA